MAFQDPAYTAQRRAQTAQQPCALSGCHRVRALAGSLCHTHMQRIHRSGSAHFNSLTKHQRQHYRNTIRTTLHHEFKRGEPEVRTMVSAVVALFASVRALSPSIPHTNDIGRCKDYVLKAQAFLYHIDRQRFLYRSKERTAKTEATFALYVLGVAMSAELMSEQICNHPTYKAHQVCQALVHMLALFEVKRYEHENQDGTIRVEKVVSFRPRLQSKAVVRRLYPMIKPIYREWLELHKGEIVRSAGPCPSAGPIQ